MVQVTISSLTPSAVPPGGWHVEYRKKGSTGAFATAIGSPFTAPLPIVFNTTDPAGTLYEVRVRRDCTVNQSANFTMTTPCDCTTAGAGFIVSASGNACEKTTTQPANVTSTNYCLAISVNTVYSEYGARIYNPGFTPNTLMLGFVSDPLIYGYMSIAPFWANPSGSTTAGPMNRSSLWIDTDCDGVKDPLAAGVKTTISAQYNNVGPARTIFLGVGGDNNFRVEVNGILITDSSLGAGAAGNSIQFKFWHIIPVPIITGLNYFNVIVTGDNLNTNAVAAVLYNNTAAQIKAATSNAGLSILFDSVNLRGQHIDIATCPSDFSLDTSGGVGNYTCVKREAAICNKA